ncbi:MAG: hypothetical protein GH151_00020 [Bacteroidetes bacterium]|nr:hypothetical protein [Bacteroidota bacterium]
MSILQIILTAISPELRDFVIECVHKLSAMAEKTPNPVDDIAVDILKILLAIKD